jgi:hypothetical protein
MFKIEPKASLAGAAELDLASVVVVGVYKNGRVTVFGSDSSDRVIDILERGLKHIDDLTE